MYTILKADCEALAGFSKKVLRVTVGGKNRYDTNLKPCVVCCALCCVGKTDTTPQFKAKPENVLLVLLGGKPKAI